MPLPPNPLPPNPLPPNPLPPNPLPSGLQSPNAAAADAMLAPPEPVGSTRVVGSNGGGGAPFPRSTSLALPLTALPSAEGGRGGGPQPGAQAGAARGRRPPAGAEVGRHRGVHGAA
eukprot:6818738-Pyramimonas_sp.AAC.1